jgi:negative regulator of flagellin synthesis FlgM
LAGGARFAPYAANGREIRMKIRPPIDLVGSKPAGTPERASGAPKGSAPAASTPSDRVQLSSLSSQLHELESSLAASGEFDRARVEAIKQAIRDGKLAIDPQAIADKMLAAELALVTKKP